MSAVRFFFVRKMFIFTRNSPMGENKQKLSFVPRFCYNLFSLPLITFSMLNNDNNVRTVKRQKFNPSSKGSEFRWNLDTLYIHCV